MSPSVQQLAVSVTNGESALKKRKTGFNGPPLAIKRRHLESDATTLDVETGGSAHFHDASSLPTHPLGVKPLGNAYDAKFNIKTRCGRLALLPEEVLIQILELFNAQNLLYLGSTCKALYAFCHLDDLWKTLFIESNPSGSFSWRGTWRATHLEFPAFSEKSLDCSGLFSDVLHRPFQCANIPLAPYFTKIPLRNSIGRFADLTVDEFRRSWAQKPFILTDPVKSWPIYQNWSIDALLQKHGDTTFRAESVDWPFATYVDYMRLNNADESPLYLFDCHFASKMGLNLSPSNPDAAYTVPACFNPDLFNVLGPHRPHHAWLIIGPKRSGSTFHADPNGTSAWNAVIRGSKYWIMFPPPADGLPPSIPGVHVSDDLSEVTSPLSLSEYLLCFHAEARRTPGCVEAVCREGEILHVPAGWYHMVVNLEEGVAVTQNFVNEAGVTDVLAFLRDRADQVSGFKKDFKNTSEGREFELFKRRLKEEYPEIYRNAMQELLQRDEKKNRKSKWEVITGKTKLDEQSANAAKAHESISGGFSFGFDVDEDVSEEL